MNSPETDQLGRRLKSISSDFKLYIEKRIELLLLNVGEHFSRMIAESVQKLAGILLLSISATFLLIALALYLGDLIGNESLGYLSVAVPLLLAGFLFLYLKPRSMVERIEGHFQKEILKAVSTNGKDQKKPLELKEPEPGNEL